MPALYGITSNANVSVSNTTGLYIGSGNVLILNSAQTLNTLLSNQGNVNFALTSDNSQVYAYSLVPINNYGNANVAAYLPVYPGILGVGPTGIQLSSTNTNFSFNAGTPNNPGPESIAIGYYAGHDNSGQFSIAQGYVAGYTSPGDNSIAIGAFAGFDRLPTNSIAIGYNAAYNNGGQANFSVINATGSQLNPTQSNSFYVAPIRTDATNVTYSLYYNTTTKEITYTTATAGTTYSNANVQAYLAANTDPTIQSLNANTVQQQSQINSINANVTAANLTIQTISANLGSFETYANVTYSTIANAGSLQTQINSTNANVTAANAAIQTISANLGSFETYANVTYSTIANAASQESEISGLRANITAANAAIQTISANLGSFETYANVTYSTIANAGSLQTQINSTNGNVTAANAAIQTLSANVGSFYTWANANFGTSNYSNANVSSYLSSGLVTTISTTGNITTTANVVATGNLSANNATVTNKITTGSLLSTGNITANTGSYFIGDGSQLTNLPTQSGTYSNTNVAAYLSGSITTGNITNTGTIVTTGNITAPNLLGTAQYFTGDLHGNVLYDSTKYRFFANAYPLTTPDNTKYANGFLTWIVPTPVYTAGVVQAPAAGSGLTTQGGQTLGAIMSANVYIAPSGGAGNRSTNGHMAYTQVMPTGNMAGVDRSRGLFSQLDVNLNGTTWGTMGSASQASLLLCASAGTTQLLGSGSAAHAVGFNSVVAVAPTNGNIAVQYATGTYNFISLASNSAVNGTTIQYARLVSGSVAGQTANLSIVNMIGIHTATGWATTGSVNPTNRYTVLNEDAGTQIQTNGNINVVSTATTGLNSTGVFTATALNAVTGVAGQFASVSNGTGKSGGAMAYWDTTNARWSWFDTNLAVS